METSLGDTALPHRRPSEPLYRSAPQSFEGARSLNEPLGRFIRMKLSNLKSLLTRSFPFSTVTILEATVIFVASSGRLAQSIINSRTKFVSAGESLHSAGISSPFQCSQPQS